MKTKKEPQAEPSKVCEYCQGTGKMVKEVHSGRSVRVSFVRCIMGCKKTKEAEKLDLRDHFR